MRCLPGAVKTDWPEAKSGDPGVKLFAIVLDFLPESDGDRFASPDSQRSLTDGAFYPVFYLSAAILLCGVRPEPRNARLPHLESGRRQLKTSNARRDLPLAILIPPDELEKVRDRIKRIKGRAPGRFTSDACIFPDTKDRLKPMKDFDSIVRDINSAFRGDEQIGWKAIDGGFILIPERVAVLGRVRRSIPGMGVTPRIGRASHIKRLMVFVMVFRFSTSLKY